MNQGAFDEIDISRDDAKAVVQRVAPYRHIACLMQPELPHMS